MTDYQRRSDIATAPSLLALARPEGQAFMAFNHVTERDGAIPRKYRELIALGVALTTQCAYCIDVHTRQARALGVAKEELAETAFIAAAVRARRRFGPFADGPASVRSRRKIRLTRGYSGRIGRGVWRRPRVNCPLCVPKSDPGLGR